MLILFYKSMTNQSVCYVRPLKKHRLLELAHRLDFCLHVGTRSAHRAHAHPVQPCM